MIASDLKRSAKMIPKQTAGGIRIPLRKFLGIFPRAHKVAIFLSFDEQPEEKSEKSEYGGDVTIQAYTPYLGRLCDGIIAVDFITHDITFKSPRVDLSGRFEPKKNQISGFVSLRDVDGLTCDKVPIKLKAIE